MVRPLMHVLVFCCCLHFFNAEPFRPKSKIVVYRQPWSALQDYNSTSDSVKSNLDHYARAAQLAKSQKADVILFPKFGIDPPMNRAHLKEYLEYIPDPRERGINPCNDPENYSDKLILYTLSCIALHNSMVVMANTGSIQDCPEGRACPQEGLSHFNTNSVFDKDGTLIMKQGRIRVRTPLLWF